MTTPVGATHLDAPNELVNVVVPPPGANAGEDPPGKDHNGTSVVLGLEVVIAGVTCGPNAVLAVARIEAPGAVRNARVSVVVRC